MVPWVAEGWTEGYGARTIKGLDPQTGCGAGPT